MIDPIFVDDEDLLRLTGMPAETLRMLDRQKGFPPRHKTMGNKRHYPSVREYLDHCYGSKIVSLRSKAHDAA